MTFAANAVSSFTRLTTSPSEPDVVPRRATLRLPLIWTLAETLIGLSLNFLVVLTVAMPTGTPAESVKTASYVSAASPEIPPSPGLTKRSLFPPTLTFSRFPIMYSIASWSETDEGLTHVVGNSTRPASVPSGRNRIIVGYLILCSSIVPPP